MLPLIYANKLLLKMKYKKSKYRSAVSDKHLESILKTETNSYIQS